MKTAMILAAGRGERLRPLTDSIPKPLCRIQGIPLIEHHVMQLAQAGIHHIVINHAHLGGQIRRHLKDGSRWGVHIDYAPEPPGGLETGGGLINALPLLGDHPFIAVNADIFTAFDYRRLPLTEVEHMHLVLVQRNPALHSHGDFGLMNNLLDNHAQDYLFSGIACYHPKIFQNLKIGRYSITPLIREYAERKEASAEYYEGLWFDIGSFERLHAANNVLNTAS